MQRFIAAVLVLLLSTVSFTHGKDPSAGACGPTSIASVPGCWGTPACAYVVASDLGSGAACKFDYCNCGGTNVPLLPQTSSGTTTIGCVSYTRQPTANDCPTAAPKVPGGGGGSSPPSSGPTSPVTTPTGIVVVTGTISGKTITETYAPTTYTQFSKLTTVVTTTIVNSQSSTVTVTVGPSGVAWTPFQPKSGVPNVPPPSTLPGASSRASRSTAVAPLPPSGTVVTATIGSSVFTQTFVPTTLSKFATLSSTITTTTQGPSSSPVTILIGPGGIEWTPFNLPSGVPEVPPPKVLPSNARALKSPTMTSLSSTKSHGTPKSTATASGATKSHSAPKPTATASDAGQSSITGAFADTSQSETTVIAGGLTLPYSKATFSNLKTITAMTTVTTPLVQTNKDNTHFTLSAAIIIVGPGGVWWYGGTGGWGLKGPSCIWPFCPPGGGGDSGGGGSGGNPDDPDTPNSPEKPSDPDDDENDEKSTQQTTEQKKTSQSSAATHSHSSSSVRSSSCSTITASDCSVLCSTPTGASKTSCSTTCTSTLKGCRVTGTTVTASASGAACTKPGGWGNVVDGDDFSDYQPLGSAGIAEPGGSTIGPSGATTTGSSRRGTTVGPSGATNTGSSRRGAESADSTASKSGSPGSSRVASPPAKTAATPTCMVDGAPWYSPTSWCDCGASATYPTLPVSAGAKSANCAYTSLPASQLTPHSTSAAPTNIPGQEGVPGCAAVVSAPGTSAYCNCGGTPAPTLSPTKSGVMNCDYTIQPTSSYDPDISQPSKSANPQPTVQCKVHLWQGLGQEYSDPEVVIDANMTDASGTLIGHNSSELNWGQGFGVDSTLPDVLIITPHTGVSDTRRLRREPDEKVAVPPPSTRPLYEHGPVDFKLGSQTWDTSSPQCTLGGWDNGNANDFFGALIFGDDYIPNRELECYFPCPQQSSKRSVPGSSEDFQRVDQEFPRDLVKSVGISPSSTIDGAPSPVEEGLHLLYARAHGPAWVKYAPSGARYYQAWKDKTGPDAVYQCNFEDDFDVNLPVKLVLPGSSIRQTLQSQGYGITREYYAIVATGPKDAADGPYANFESTISATQGVYLANANNRGALPSDPNDPQYNPNNPNGRAPVPWQFSSVAWWMWVKTVLQANPDWQTDPSEADYSGLKSMWRRDITNEETKEILDEAFAGKDLYTVQIWTPDDTDQDSNPFWALLGSPNGNGMQYILTDNKIALKGKGIKGISAVAVASGDTDGNGNKIGFYSMWATYG